MKPITAETLKKWNACMSGFLKFCELFHDGADLRTASDGLIAAGRTDYSDWLWAKCATDDDYREQTIVSGGDYATVSGGDYATVSGCDYATVSGGDYATVSGGEGAALVLRSHKHPYYMICATVDGQRIKAGVKYRLNDNNEFTEVTDDQ